jgi:hypothetical protein
VKLRDFERHLSAHDCRKIGEGARHSKWRGPTDHASAVPRHREIAAGTARAICKQLEVPAP